MLLFFYTACNHKYQSFLSFVLLLTLQVHQRKKKKYAAANAQLLGSAKMCVKL